MALDAGLGGVRPGWQAVGWAKAEALPSGVLALDLSQQRTWGLAAARLEGKYVALVLRVTAPEAVLAELEVRVDSLRAEVFPRVALSQAVRTPLAGGEVNLRLPLSALNPAGRTFDRIILRARRNLDGARVLLSFVGLEQEPQTAPAPPSPADRPGAPAGPPPKPAARPPVPSPLTTPPPRTPAGPTPAPAPAPAAGSPLVIAPLDLSGSKRTVALQIDCGKNRRPISSMVYGIAFRPDRDPPDGEQWTLGATARRWGGNPASRYNWKLGNAWNTALDWYFQNVNYTGRPHFSWRDFLAAQQQHGLMTALTLPTLGWVAKDTSSYSFPVGLVGAQGSTAPEKPDAGNGTGANGKPIRPLSPTQTSVQAPPEFIREWVSAIRGSGAGRRPVDVYILDNEPGLWNSTHRDVHPDPVTYEELLDRTIRYGEAVRQADPEAVIAGPAEWGWSGYLYSAQDAKLGFGLHPDRLTHGNTPLVPWLLRNVRAREAKTGVRILDLLDLHFYPQGKGIGVGTSGETDRRTNALRIRSTRALWDPGYVDESWIGEPIRLIPRMREWVRDNAPGLGLMIGEWSFGAENHLSGALAVAEALGRFGAEGVTGAFYWTFPPRDSPVANAFRAYRNFDGQGGRFLDLSVSARSSASTAVSPFASVSEDGSRLVAVLLNFDTGLPADTRLELRGCHAMQAATLRSYVGGPAFGPSAPVQTMQGSLGLLLPPYSINVLELRLEP